jgi:hypothetical protein
MSSNSRTQWTYSFVVQVSMLIIVALVCGRSRTCIVSFTSQCTPQGREIHRLRRLFICRAQPDDDMELEALMAEDLRNFQPRKPTSENGSQPHGSQAADSPFSGLVDKVSNIPSTTCAKRTCFAVQRGRKNWVLSVWAYCDIVIDMLKLPSQVLIADFFFILLILAWFVAGVAETSTLRSSKILDVWYPLWPTVFQPALGVLMLGALTSGLLGRKESSSSSS